jgi:hypothetical protein
MSSPSPEFGGGVGGDGGGECRGSSVTEPVLFFGQPKTNAGCKLCGVALAWSPLRQPQDHAAVGLARAAEGAHPVHEPRFKPYPALALRVRLTFVAYR